jgi:hypothetical protein
MDWKNIFWSDVNVIINFFRKSQMTKNLKWSGAYPKTFAFILYFRVEKYILIENWKLKCY